MRLMVRVGSLDEKDDERGMAHFVEHMAFEGTRNFQSGELIAFFQLLGMGYGVDVNAFTYHDKTVYHLELPKNDAELVGQSLKLYRDYADGLLFDPARIENQRQVILRERQSRETPKSRISQESFRFSFAGSRLVDRHPIGSLELVRTVTRDELLRFYRKWYRPDLMTLVVVGDFDELSLIGSIEENFASLVSPKGKLPKRRLGRLARSKPFRHLALEVDGVERYTLELSRAWNERPRKDSFSLRRKDTARGIATALFNKRCRLAIDGLSNDFASYDRVLGFPFCQVTISSGGAFWWEAFVWLDQLLRQALDHGFTQQEFDELRRDWLQRANNAAARFESAEPRMLIDQIVEAVAEDRVYTGSEANARHLERNLSSLTLEEVDRAFAEVWNLKRLSYFIAGDFEWPVDIDLLKGRLRSERRNFVPAYVPRSREAFAYSEFGDVGEIVEKGKLSGIEAETYRFANNARLTVLPTENEKGTVRILVRIGGGMLDFRDSNPGTHALAMASLFRSGFGEHPIEDIYSELRRNVSSFVFSMEDHDAFAFRAVTPTDGLDEALKIASEYLLSPRIDEKAFELTKSKFKQSRELEPDGLSEAYRDLYRMLYPGQPRFHAPTLDEISRVELETLRTWMERAFREGYLEVAIVGDFEMEQALALARETFGALPERKASKSDFDAVRKLRIAAQAGKRQIEYQKGRGENAASVVVWTIQDDISFRESAALYLLSSVLENRLRARARDQLGVSYSPSVSYITFPAYDTLRHIRADVDCLKNDADRLLGVVLEIAAQLREEPIEELELRTAVAPLEEGLKQGWLDNRYLLENVLHGVQEYPQQVENALSYKDGLLSTITAEEILALAKRYLKSDDALAVAILPALSPEVAEGPVLLAPLRAGARP